MTKGFGYLSGAAFIAAALSSPARADVGPNTQLDPSGDVLSNITISVSDLDRSAKFYKALGFEVGATSVLPPVLSKLLEAGDNPKAEIAFAKRDGVVVELIHFTSPAVKARPSKGVAAQLGLSQIAFRVDDTDRFIALIKANGGKALDKTRTKLGTVGKGSDIIFCTDPDGTRIEVVGPIKD